MVERSYAFGKLKSHGKTARSRRRVPLSARAKAAFEQLPPRIDTRVLFPNAKANYTNLHSFRSRDWSPAVEAAGLDGRRIYDLRHSFASHALAAGLGLCELARYMGTSVEQIDKTYGHLVQGAEDAARAKLDAYQERLGHDEARTTEAQE